MIRNNIFQYVIIILSGKIEQRSVWKTMSLWTQQWYYTIQYIYYIQSRTIRSIKLTNSIRQYGGQTIPYIVHGGINMVLSPVQSDNRVYLEPIITCYHGAVPCMS